MAWHRVHDPQPPLPRPENERLPRHGGLLQRCGDDSEPTYRGRSLDAGVWRRFGSSPGDARSLSWILNGLDSELFNPRTDKHIHQQFDLGSIEDRDINRAALRAELKLPDDEGPVLAMVTRLTEQKGVDLVLRALPEVIAAGGQLVVLGDGDKWLKDELGRLEDEHRSHVRLVARFDEGLAQRIYAGCDMFLMPSRYEPCGLGQLMAMRYGAIPIGRRTGGLADTIIDLDESPDTATGFLFDEFSPHGFATAFERAVRVFRDEPTWLKLQQNAMGRDYSWRASATHYVEAYIAALRARGIVPLD